MSTVQSTHCDSKSYSIVKNIWPYQYFIIGLQHTLFLLIGKENMGVYDYN